MNHADASVMQNLTSITSFLFALFVLWRTSRLEKTLKGLVSEYKKMSVSYGHLRAAVSWAASQGVVESDPDVLVKMYLDHQTKTFLGGLYRRPVQ